MRAKQAKAAWGTSDSPHVAGDQNKTKTRTVKKIWIGVNPIKGKETCVRKASSWDVRIEWLSPGHGHKTAHSTLPAACQSPGAERCP